MHALFSHNLLIVFQCIFIATKSCGDRRFIYKSVCSIRVIQESTVDYIGLQVSIVCTHLRSPNSKTALHAYIQTQ